MQSGAGRRGRCRPYRDTKRSALGLYGRSVSNLALPLRRTRTESADPKPRIVCCLTRRRGASTSTDRSAGERRTRGASFDSAICSAPRARRRLDGCRAHPDGLRRRRAGETGQARKGHQRQGDDPQPLPRGRSRPGDPVDLDRRLHQRQRRHPAPSRRDQLTGPGQRSGQGDRRSRTRPRRPAGGGAVEDRAAVAGAGAQQQTGSEHGQVRLPRPSPRSAQ